MIVDQPLDFQIDVRFYSCHTAITMETIYFNLAATVYETPFMTVLVQHCWIAFSIFLIWSVDISFSLA